MKKMKNIIKYTVTYHISV